MKPSHIDDIRDARTESDLLNALVAVGNSLGFAFATMTVSRGRPANNLLVGKSIQNLPDTWSTSFRNLDTALVDPVFVRVYRSTEPFFYDQSFYARAGAGPLWEESAAHGIRAGVCSAIELPGDSRIYWGFDGDEKLPKSDKLQIQILAATQLAGVVAIAAAKNILSWDDPPLTETHLAILRLTQEGKSSWDISMILGMSVDTVNYHLKKCRARLGVATKHQAVHKAVSLGLMS